MPNLQQLLLKYDLGLIKIIMDAWGIVFDEKNEQNSISELANQLLCHDKVKEILDSLPPEANEALEYLVKRGGKETWAKFSRKFGIVRKMGPAKRERERPFDVKNAAPAEYLFYRGLIGSAFFDTESGPMEFAFIPDDLIPILPILHPVSEKDYIILASPIERAYVINGSDSILDDACTLLAGLRNGFLLTDLARSFVRADPGYENSVPNLSITPEILFALLSEAGLFDANGIPNPENTKRFLEVDRGVALSNLVNVWLNSNKLNELRMLPDIIVEGEWQNNPKKTREILLDLILQVSSRAKDSEEFLYLSMSMFVKYIKEIYPDFQRPTADYDSWYIRIKNSNKYLRGFENWEKIDGDLIRFFISGPLHWLGITDIALPEYSNSPKVGSISAFRLSIRGEKLLRKATLEDSFEGKTRILVKSDGRIRIPHHFSRRERYQISRFCTWDGFRSGYYHYHITPQSLMNASKQGLVINQMVGLLKKNSEAVPPSLIKALEGWEKNGSQARFENLVVLRLGKPEMMQQIRNSRANRFLGDPIGPTSVIVKKGAVEKVQAILAEMGYLGEITFDD